MSVFVNDGYGNFVVGVVDLVVNVVLMVEVWFWCRGDLEGI